MEQEIVNLHKFISEYADLKSEISKLEDVFNNADNTSHYVSILNELNAVALSGISVKNRLVLESKTNSRIRLFATKKGIRTIGTYETHSRELDWDDYVELMNNEAKITAWFKKSAPKKLQRWLDFKGAFIPFMASLFEFGIGDYDKKDSHRRVFETPVGEDFKILVKRSSFNNGDDDNDDGDEDDFVITSVHIDCVGVRFRYPSDEPIVYLLSSESRGFLEKAVDKDGKLFGTNKSLYILDVGNGRDYDKIEDLEFYGYSELIPKLKACVVSAKADIVEKLSPISQAEADMKKKLSKYTALKVI